MHELSLATGILELVERAAEREQFTRVASLELEAGALSCVDVRALRFALEVLAPGSLLEGARLDISQPAGRAHCCTCEREIALSARGAACPHCNGYALRLTAGTELRLLRLTVHDG